MRQSTPKNQQFVAAITANPRVTAFRVAVPHGEDPHKWQLEPLDVTVLNDDGKRDGFFIISALQVLPDGQVRNCYMDISLPERINDYAYFVENGTLHYNYSYTFKESIIPAIAIVCFGVYELFYSNTAPQIGIEVLKEGLKNSKRKHFIAEDLGYIYRDENRYREAAEMFQIAANEEVSSHYIYQELAQAYGKIGEVEKQKKCKELFNRHERGIL